MPLPKLTLRLHGSSLVFTPKLAPTIGLLLLLPLLISLGAWQLHRAHFKKNLIDTYHARFDAKPLASRALDRRSATQLQFYPMRLSGTYDNQHSLLVENQFQHHHLGYRILTPFHADNAKQWILVDRGWVPRGTSRTQLPHIHPINGTMTIEGRLKRIPAQTFTLGTLPAQSAWPRVISALNLKQIHHVLKRQLYPVLLQLPASVHNDPYQQWHVTTISPAKHYGYAVQWLALALTLAIIYLILNTQREKHAKE